MWGGERKKKRRGGETGGKKEEPNGISPDRGVERRSTRSRIFLSLRRRRREETTNVIFSGRREGTARGPQYPLQPRRMGGGKEKRKEEASNPAGWRAIRRGEQMGGVEMLWSPDDGCRKKDADRPMKEDPLCMRRRGGPYQKGRTAAWYGLVR